MKKTGLWISVGTLLVAILALGPAYLVFYDKPDLVYETHVENIPLPKDLPGQLPDTLAIITVENVGHQPSIDLQGNVSVGGDLIEYQVQGPNPAYGHVSHSRNNGQIIFSCSRLASGEYPITISAWYRGANLELDVGVSDSHGAGRRVNSIGLEKAKYKEAGTGFLGLLVGLFGSFVAIWAMYDSRRMRKRIVEAARQIQQNTERLKAATDRAGTTAGQPRDNE